MNRLEKIRIGCEIIRTLCPIVMIGLQMIIIASLIP